MSLGRYDLFMETVCGNSSNECGTIQVQDLQLVSIEFMPTVTIINKSLAASGLCLFIGGDDFRNAREIIRDCGNILAEIDQQIAVV